MAILKKLDISTAKDLQTEVVDVPEWGGEVVVSEIGAADFISLWTDPQFTGADGKTPDMAKLMPALLVRCLVDEEGNRILDDADAQMLGRKSSAAFKRLADVARKLNKIGAGDEETKNSKPSLTEDSSSVSA